MYVKRRLVHVFCSYYNCHATCSYEVTLSHAQNCCKTFVPCDCYTLKHINNHHCHILLQQDVQVDGCLSFNAKWLT